jgi:hypothetical protein
VTAGTAAGVDEPAVRSLALSAGVLALALLALGLVVRAPQLAAGAVALVGGGYAAGLAADGAPLDTRAPLYAAALLLTCELALWSHALRTSTPGEAGMIARHAAWLGLLVLAALAVGAGLIALVDVARTDGAAIDALGAAAALALVAMLLRAARTPSGRR